MEKIEIKHEITGELLWTGKAESIKDAVVKAVGDGANLDGANLDGAYLDGAYLRGANLYGANLRGANLYGANLDGANLRGANLDGAYLRGANLDGANLDGAYLDGAYLDGAYLDGAYLRGANLDGANLRGANLDGANLRGADLDGANLDGAYLDGAYLDGAYLDDKTILDTGETWLEYLTQTMPALLAAGGRSLAEFKEHWTCHEWTNCPMAFAFGVQSGNACPILLRPRVRQFVKLFDAKLIPWEAIQKLINAAKAEAETMNAINGDPDDPGQYDTDNA